MQHNKIKGNFCINSHNKFIETLLGVLKEQQKEIDKLKKAKI